MADGRLIVVHHFDHVVAALEAAQEAGVPVVLQSAPEAIFYAGNLFLKHMFMQAKAQFPGVEAHFIVDCGDAGAEALGAIAMGHTHLRSSAEPEIYAKIADAAEQYGVTMVSGEPEILDLRPARVPKEACLAFLSS